MIIGIGTDLVEVKRIEKIISDSKFLEKFFTEAEQDMIKASSNRSVKAAGNFAVKEALSKAAGTGFSGFKLTDIEVLREESGKPYVNVTGSFAEIINTLGSNKIHTTISNTKDYVVAYVICEREM